MKFSRIASAQNIVLRKQQLRFYWIAIGVGLLFSAHSDAAAPSHPLPYSPLDYGARCDSDGASGTDDSTAINAMFAAIRVAKDPFKVIFPSGHCFISSTINMTGLKAVGSTIEGMAIDCASKGTPCVDAMDTRFINWNEIYIHGLRDNAPNIGLQLGRVNGSVADDHFFNRPFIWGYFTLAPFYNLAAETMTLVEPFFSNFAEGKTYSLILDGYNHFNLKSRFLSKSLPVDVPQSFNENVFVGGSFLNVSSNGSSIWLGATARHGFLRSYAAASGTECIDLYQEGPQQNRFLNLDLHCENSGGRLKSVFLISGPQTTPTINGLHYLDHSPQPTSSVFRTEEAIVNVTVADLDVRVNDFANGGGSAVKLFEDPNRWVVSGHIQLASAANWTPPKIFEGELCIGTKCIGWAPSPALNRNPDFLIDQQNNGTPNRISSDGDLVIDGWHARTNAPSTAVLVFQQRDTLGPPGASNYLHIGVEKPIAADSFPRFLIDSAIEGADVAPLRWGTSAAMPVTFGFWARANNVGVYNAVLQNGARDRSYVVKYHITQVNSWSYFVFYVPGDSRGAWLHRRNTIGLFLAFCLAGSSQSRAAADGWEDGDYSNSADALPFAGTTNATLDIAAVHFRLGNVDLPYQPRSLSEELSRAQHWYATSFANYKTVKRGVVLNGTTNFQAVSKNAGTQISLPMPMFTSEDVAAPLIRLYSPYSSKPVCYDSTTGSDTTSARIVDASDKGFFVECLLDKTESVGDLLQVQWTADSGK